MSVEIQHHKSTADHLLTNVKNLVHQYLNFLQCCVINTSRGQAGNKDKTDTQTER